MRRAGCLLPCLPIALVLLLPLGCERRSPKADDSKPAPDPSPATLGSPETPEPTPEPPPPVPPDKLELIEGVLLHDDRRLELVAELHNHSDDWIHAQGRLRLLDAGGRVLAEEPLSIPGSVAPDARVPFSHTRGDADWRALAEAFDHHELALEAVVGQPAGRGELELSERREDGTHPGREWIEVRGSFNVVGAAPCLDPHVLLTTHTAEGAAQTLARTAVKGPEGELLRELGPGAKGSFSATLYEVPDSYELRATPRCL